MVVGILKTVFHHHVESYQMQIRRIIFFLWAAFLLTSQSTTTNAETLIISNARLIDGTGAAPLTGVSVLVKGKHIHSIGKDIEQQNEVVVIDATGLTIMPGLIDMHTHPTFEILAEKPRMPFPTPDSLPSSDEDMREFIKSRLPRRLNKFLEGGITTVISAGGYWPFDIEIRDRIAAGELKGPRMLVASPIFTAPGGHPASGICSGAPWCSEKLAVEAANADVARAAVRRYADGGVQAIKFVYDSFDKTFLGGPDLAFPNLDKDIMAAIISEAKAVGLPVIAHTKTVNETADVLKAGVDALVHATLMENVSFTTSEGKYLPRLIKEQNLSITTTIRSFYERLQSAIPAARARLQRNFDLVGPSLRAYADAGITLMFGTDFDGAGIDPDPGEAVRSEARALVAAGFNEMEVISMATGNASQHPMVPNEQGTIESGKLADIIILADDPLQDISAITRPLVVIKAGSIVIDKR